jgi:hypothetical protein
MARGFTMASYPQCRRFDSYRRHQFRNLIGYRGDIEGAGVGSNC